MHRAGAAVGSVRSRLERELGADALVTDLSELRTYECDGLSHLAVVPALVVLARTAREVGAAVSACADSGVPFVARGAGTGLSGGAVPHADGVLVVTAKMRRILEIDLANERCVVEPGVANLDVTRAVAPHGYYYAPDPSSQQVCSIGGNVAENSGGAHCLKHGFTTNHVTGLEVVTPDGQTVELGGKALDPPGYDLVGAFVGSEGTLGVATKVTLRLSRSPETVHTLLAGFVDTDSAGAAVSAIVGAGLLPSAIEMMDKLAISAAEAAVDCHYPDGAGAVLIVELDGPHPDVVASIAEVERHCGEAGAFALRHARDDAERAGIWKGRKSAFAAVGRISPDYIVQDGVVPRTELPAVLREIARLSAASGIRVANVFHAGDGNLHPLVLFDANVAGELAGATELSHAILDLCLEHGGSITGEHGVGLDKRSAMDAMFGADDLDTMQMLRCAFDPHGICNPGKVFPTPRLCGERPGRRTGQHPLVESGLAELY
ncbi:MAG: FAD-linked oxidase C-terminal domain-containing protein [Acidimicrobiales bacterium]